MYDAPNAATHADVANPGLAICSKSPGIVKRIHFRIIPPEPMEEERGSLRAPAKQRFTEDGIETSLEKVVEYIDQKYPLFEFRMVQVAKNKFNFIGVGLRSSGPCHVVDFKVAGDN